MRLANFIVLLLTLGAFSVSAQDGRVGIRPIGGERPRAQMPSSLTVYTENGAPFFLVVNGMRRNDEPRQRVWAAGLSPFNNNIEIDFADNVTPPIRRQLNLADPLEGEPVDMTLVITIDREGRPRLKFMQAVSAERGRTDHDMPYVGTGNGRPMGVAPQPPMATPSTPPPPAPMDPASFNDAKTAIQSANFDDGKFSTAKTILATNYLTVDQVIQVCNLFAFDDRKLDFAKFAYSHTVDPNNYYRVAAVFAFDTNKEALNNYIRSQH